MSNTDNKSSGGFFRRILGRSNPAPPSATRNESGEITMSTPGEQAGGKRLARPKSVLVIAADDNAPRRWRKEMEEVGYGVESVADGAKGLDILYGFSFDALLIDFTAPGVDGLTLLRQIRTHDELKSLFIGVLLNEKDGDPDREMAALDAGASRVFPRGTVKPDEILTALKTALFPRILQAQPRARQSAAPAAPAAPPTPKPEPIPAPAIQMAPSAPADTAAPAAVTASTVPIAMPPPRRTFRVPPPEMGKSGQPMPTVINKKILIIDADESVAAIYRAQIEAAGYEVEVALDGETGFHDLYTINPRRAPAGPPPSRWHVGLRNPQEDPRAEKVREDAHPRLHEHLHPRRGGGSPRRRGSPPLQQGRRHPARRDRRAQRNLPAERRGAGLAGRLHLSRSFDVPGSFAPRRRVRPGQGRPAASDRQRAEITLHSRSPPLPKSAIPAPAPLKATDDSDFQKEIRESLLQDAPEFVKSLRGMLQVLLRSQGDTESQAAQLLELYTRVHSLTGNAAIAGFTKVARLAGAVEAMLREFQTKPEGLNASTKRTLTQAMDFLALLFTNAATHESGKPLEERILVVDDEIISRRVIGHSLEKAGLKSTAVSHPDEALKLLEEKGFDLIFLDVEMPGMNGFELCKRLRAMQQHARTPVIFVTALNGFESRAKSSLSGGDDFIGKPFSYIELAVKGLIYVLRGTIGEARNVSGKPPVPASPVAAPAADRAALASHS